MESVIETGTIDINLDKCPSCAIATHVKMNRDGFDNRAKGLMVINVDP